MAERKSKASEAQTDESSAPAKTASKSPSAAPLDAPAPKPAPEPADPVVMPASTIAPTTPFSNRTTRLLDEHGNPLAVEDFLEYPAQDAPRHQTDHPETFIKDPRRLVTVTQRVFREYTPDNAKTKVTQLLFNKGTRITKAQADRLKADEMPPPNGAGVWTGGPVGQMDPKMHQMMEQKSD